MITLKIAAEYLLHVLFSRTCLHCRRDLSFRDESPLCPGCAGGLEPIPELHCKRCGLPLPDGGAHCYDCRGSKSAEYKCSLIRAAFVFNPQFRSLIHAFKYRPRPGLSRELGKFLSMAWDRYPEIQQYDTVVYVPLHREKEKERGFNQSRLLAEVLASVKKLTLLEGGLERSRNTRAQAKLSKEERTLNVKDAFNVVKQEKIKGRKILIIDDVSTTGATLEACAVELKKAGAKSVAALVLAREP